MKTNKDKSTLSKLGFIFEHCVWTVVSFIIYKSILFISLGNYSPSSSKFILLLCIFFTSSVGIIIRWQNFRTTLSVLADIFCGIGIYTMIAYKDYYFTWIFTLFTLFIIFFIFITSSSAWAFYKKSKNTFSPHNQRTWGNLFIKKGLLRVLNISEFFYALIVVIMIIPIGYHQIMYGGLLMANTHNINGEDNKKYDNWSDYELSKNIASISLLRSEKTWQPLTIQEKINVLQDVCNCESNYWGIDSLIHIVVNDLDNSLLGSYNDKERIILIDKQHIEQDTPEKILATVLHEMYHAWEYCLVRLYLDSNEVQQRLSIFNHCDKYVQEIEDYVTSDGDFESYMAYSSQYLEKDANEYSKQALLKYYREIDKLLGIE